MRRKGSSWYLDASSTSPLTPKPRFGLFGFLVLLLFQRHTAVAEARQLSTGGGADDAAGLLAFKKSSVHSDPNGFLSNWKVETGSRSPCSWTGVSCSDSSGRVESLSLENAGLIGSLSLPQLASLPALRFLNLRGNSFSTDNLSASSSPCLLESLDLSSNNLSDPLPRNSFLISCPHLKYVNLSRNSITGGALPIGPSLLQLDLSRNQISDPTFLTNLLSGCRNLNLLDLSSNKLTGKLGTTDLSSCRSLLVIDISNNQLSGEIPPSFIADSPASLQHLDLSHNNFSGSFSGLDFGSCVNLTMLNLSSNCLSGNHFPSSLRNCQLLEMVDLSHNQLGGMIPGTLWQDLKNLRRLFLSDSQFTGRIPPELALTCGTLEEIDLSRNNLNGGLPPTFGPCSSLRSLNLGNNNLSGDFLETVVSNLSSLQYLRVPFNNITGPIPLSLTRLPQLRVLDLSSNAFSGNVPSGFCSSPSSSTSLEKLLLPGNYISGTLPSELGNCKNLTAIDLSFNNLNGEIPREIWALPNLSDLIIWANNLTGEIPEGICVNGGNLETLILNNNLISGRIPESIVNCTNMVWVSLSSNRLSGSIPSGIGDLQNLAILQLGNNSLTGMIPPEIGYCKSLIWLDLNSNGFEGPLPPELAEQSGLVMPGSVSGKQFVFVRNEGGTSCRGAGGLVEFEGIRELRLQSSPIVHSCLSTRIYSGKTVYSFESNGSMIYLDLSYNLFSETIPENFGSMKFLQVLNLGHNNLTGTIPGSFGVLRALGVLDLSHNNLQGSIPGSLGSLNFLNDLDVSNNHLTGPIPSGGQLTTFPASRYDNNTGLCGLPLPPCGSGNRPSNPSFRVRRQSYEAGMVIGIGLFVICILALAVTLYRVKENHKKSGNQKENKYVESISTSGDITWKISSIHEPLSINVATFEKPLRKLTFTHLLEATNNFSAESRIGCGGFGEVYKAKLREGNMVAIKKLIHVTSQGDREFVAEMETIGKIKHRNLVPLMGYCKVGEERLLVYEYMRFGSLESVLHDHRVNGGSPAPIKLNWAMRKRIAIGAARGLAFLHHSCIPHVIHRDMKSSNVLLDENFEARVSDFGMARLVNALDTHLSVSTLAGTPGYVPPEYYQSFRCTTKGDVYSYGVVLLELLSGKRPIDQSKFGDDNNLVGWAKQLHRDNRSNEILDPELSVRKSGQAEMYHYLRVAFECLDDRPDRRPTMIEVMAMFKELQVDSESDILDDFSLDEAVIHESGEKEP